MAVNFSKTILLLFTNLLLNQFLFAHNGSIAYAYPLGRITVDGNFSDWPAEGLKYRINKVLSDTKPVDESDFSGYFQIGYRLENQSMYIAFTIADNNFIEDSTEILQWNTQDGLELSIDARHLRSGSGVASFMYSKKLRNINNAFYDPFAMTANWDIVEVATSSIGNTRYYEWRIILGPEMALAKTVGFDFQFFDKDSDESFSFSSWGNGGSKFMNPKSLGDVVFLPANARLGTVSGNVSWDKQLKQKLPGQVLFKVSNNPTLWLAVELDSSGKYSTSVPAGKYEVLLPNAFYVNGDKVYSTSPKKSISVLIKAGEHNAAPNLIIPGVPVPDLIPNKGILQILHQQAPARWIILLKHTKSILISPVFHLH